MPLTPQARSEVSVFPSSHIQNFKIPFFESQTPKSLSLSAGMIQGLTRTVLATQIRKRKNLKEEVPYVPCPRHRENGLANPIVPGTTTTTNSRLGKFLETLELSSVLGLLPALYVVSIFSPFSFFIYYHESDSLN